MFIKKNLIKSVLLCSILAIIFCSISNKAMNKKKSTAQEVCATLDTIVQIILKNPNIYVRINPELREQIKDNQTLKEKLELIELLNNQNVIKTEKKKLDQK